MERQETVSNFQKAAQVCKAAGGILDSNRCTIREGGRRIQIDLWTPFTKDKPELHVNREDVESYKKVASSTTYRGKDVRFWGKPELHVNLVFNPANPKG